MGFLITLFLAASSACAFQVQYPAGRQSTQLFLEDRIADMIDNELWREHHRQEFASEWMEKNRGAVLSRLSDDTNTMMVDDDAVQEFRQKAKDRTLANRDPAAYCADRCVSTGNCDVYEDIFQFSPEEVMSFCTDCVLSEEEEPCDVPDAFYDLENEIQSKLGSTGLSP